MNILTKGDKMADSHLVDLNGNTIKLSELNDKYMLLSFWSLGCMICMNAASGIKNIHNQYKRKLNIVSINMDTEKSMWEQGSKRDGITWTNLSDGLGTSDGIGKSYSIASYPSYILINKDGIIIDRWMGHKPGRIESKLADMIK